MTVAALMAATTRPPQRPETITRAAARPTTAAIMVDAVAIASDTAIDTGNAPDCAV